MKPTRVVLRFSIRGRDGASEHALVARMKRRTWQETHRGWHPTWRLMSLELRWRKSEAHPLRVRAIPTRRVNKTDRETLAVMAERAARNAIGRWGATDA